MAFAYAYTRATREAETELRRALAESSAVLADNRAELTDTFTRLARLVADLPKLKAAIATGDPPTVQPLADDYRSEIRADVLLLTSGDLVLGASGPMPAELPATIRVKSVDELSTFWEYPHGLMEVISVPIFIAGEPPDLLGRLTVGFLLDDAAAAQLKRLTASEITFALDGHIVASTHPTAVHEQLARLLDQREISATVGDEDFIGVSLPLRTGNSLSDAATASRTPTALLLRSRTERLRYLDTIRAGLIGALVFTLIVATLVSYAVARTVTRPLTAITHAMSDITATGDLTRKVVLRSGRWDDEDARLLAGAFNTLTDSIAKFQSEAAQKDRLSSLGRLSTVIAHEVRNPLMIIKASARTLRDTPDLDADSQEAVHDIEEEVNRLNRIVTDVLDFAKPIRFELADTNVNELCRQSAEAAWADNPERAAALDLDPSLPPLCVDAERLRTALVNLLTNARHAVQDASASPAVRLSTRRDGTRASIVVDDRGVGIAPEDLPHVFDPYFTTRRAGTGLGLPITKNIIEGMGGTIHVTSRPGEGTVVRIELPLSSPGSAS